MRLNRIGALILGAGVQAVAPSDQDILTVTSIITETEYRETTIEYHSTIWIRPGSCDKTTTTVNGVGPPPQIPSASDTGSDYGANTMISDGADPTIHATGNWLDWANDVSTIGIDGEVFTWTGMVPTVTPSAPAPTYTGLLSDDSLPEPGSPMSNVTEPQEGVSGGLHCNTADDRSSWCDGRSIDSNYYTDDYDTGQVCSYDFTITNTTWDFDGSGARIAFAINGQIPGPLIECNWGDLLQVTVHNELLDNSTSIHWHGITQKGTNDQDGVPGVTQCGIAPGSSRTYTMRLNQYGTGWYHSHAMTQYGDGIRGPMIVHGPATSNFDFDMGTVMIDDTFDVTATQQNARIAHIGPTGTVNYLLNGRNTRPDLSAGLHSLWSVQPGKKHLFRFINSASQNMFSMHFDNHLMTVIATDYVPIVPYQTEWLNIAIGQRYDVVVEMDQPVGGYFLRAVAQTGCPSGSENTGLGNANGIILYQGVATTLPTSTYSGKTAGDFAVCLDEPIASLVPYLQKSAGSTDQFSATAATLPAGNVANIATSDDGAVFRWFLNNGAISVNYTQPTLQTLAEGSNASSVSNSIILNTANEWVYFIIQNQFFASHPMHLHGHDLSLLGQGPGNWDSSLVSTLNFDNPPRRDTVMLAGSPGPGSPAGYTVIGFETDNPGVWLMHCHIVWHVDGGLALQWLERPSEIPPYADAQAFKDECSAQAVYEAADPLRRVHSTGESGLKRRTNSGDLHEACSKDMVRRDVSHKKEFFGLNLRHGFGRRNSKHRQH